MLKINKKNIKKYKGKIIAGIIVLCVLAYIVMGSIRGSKVIPEEVMTAKAYKGDITQTISSTGTVKSDAAVISYSLAAAKVELAHVEVGDLVKKGDMLISYDQDSLDSAILENELSLKSAGLSYDDAVNENYSNQKKYKDAISDIETLTLQIDEKERYIDGLKKGITQENAKRKEEILREQEKYNLLMISYNQQLNKAGSNLSSDDINYYTGLINDCKASLARLDTESMLLNNYSGEDDREELLKIAEKDLAVYKENLALAKQAKEKASNLIMSSYKSESVKTSSELQQHQINTKLSKLEDAKSGIKAEVDGVVTEVNVVNGSLVSEGAALIKIESLEKVSVVFGASKYDLEKLRIGQKTDILIAGTTYEGVVSKINHFATGKSSNGAATVNVKVDIINPDDSIFLGIDGKVTVYVDEAKDAVLIPSEAVNADREGEFVYVVKDGIAIKQYVKTGVTSVTEIEILEGINEGDDVITLVSNTIFDGKKVAIVKEGR